MFFLLLAVIDFVHFTDTHVIKMDGIHPEIAAARASNGPSRATLEKFVTAFKPGSAAFAIHTGDMIDAWCFDTTSGAPVYGQIEDFTRPASKLPVKLYPVLGNHDVECYRRNPKDPKAPVGDQSVAAQTRQAWRKALPGFRKGTYYSFAKKVDGTRYRFVILDNGEAAQSNLTAQMTWLSAELKKYPNDKVILALHIPIGTTDLFSKSLGAAVGGSTNVMMILCGHRHTDDISPIALGASKPTQVRTSAMFKGADQWRRIRLHKDKIEVSATGSPDKVAATIAVSR